LDDDKARMVEEQRIKDIASLAKWNGGSRLDSQGYRFASHPADFQDAPLKRPFEGLSSSWRPPSPNGTSPAGRRERSHGATGAYWEGSHGLKKSASTSGVPKSEGAMQAAHPLSVELRRWKRLANTQERELKDAPIPEAPQRKVEDPSKEPLFPKGGLVNFPRYMLINDCSLKRAECQRFLAQQRQLAEEQAALAEASPTNQAQPTASSWRSEQSRGRNAGHLMPSGRGSRTSNPFRFG